MTDVAAIIGVGPINGLGAQLCLRFAKEGLHVLVAGRTPDNLDAVVGAIADAGGSSEAYPTDATSEVGLPVRLVRSSSKKSVRPRVADINRNWARFNSSNGTCQAQPRCGSAQ